MSFMFARNVDSGSASRSKDDLIHRLGGAVRLPVARGAPLVDAASSLFKRGNEF
jgi:hypothetical protein